MKKILSLMLCAVLTFAWYLPAYALEDEKVIHITSLEEFLTFAENCRLDSFSAGKHFLLTADIDLTGTDFDGIAIFCGIFDGGYHSIQGLNIQSAGDYKGLFRHIQVDAVVKNLQVEGKITPSEHRNTIGGIAGTNAGTIENCTFTGTVTGSQYAGGIVGINKPSGIISDCTAYGTVSALHFSGGITGSNEGSIRHCSNHAGVNRTAQQNQVNIGDITLGTLTDTESATATTDIGGIAGFSSGTILDCQNHGTVGYRHMGYNVGGIAGLQTGYVSGCVNHGEIYGRKEVGGIVGQQEPQVIVRYDTDTLMILKTQFAVLSDLLDKAAANTQSNAATIQNLIHKIRTHIADAEEAMEFLQAGLEDPKWEDLEEYGEALKTIRDSLEGVETCMGKLWSAIDTASEDLKADLNAVSEQMAVIEQTLNNADSHLGGQVFDISDQDTSEDLGSKIENCGNFGPVLADLNAGGIVGAIVFENDLDPEEDISVVGDMTLNVMGCLRSVILSCRNEGQVQAKTQRIGGIVGWMTMGLVKNCINTGSLENPTASYVGGIAGQSQGYIRNCQVKSILAGDAQVGGIAGAGSIVSDSYAMVALTANAFRGGILGQSVDAYQSEEVPIFGNFYLQFGKDPGAIDGISYHGMAQGLGLTEFFHQAGSDLFGQVTIRFFADGQLVAEVTQEAGSALTDLPSVPQKNGYSGRWQEIAQLDLSCVFFDLQIHAEYISYSATLGSDMTDDNGRPILLLQGDFALGATASLTPIDNPAALAEGQTWLQGWHFRLENAVQLSAGRLLLPKEPAADRLLLLVRDSNGRWSQRPYTVDGSYMIFSLADTDDGVALIQAPAEKLLSREVVVAGGVGAVGALVVVIPFVILRSRKKKKVAAATEE